MTTERLPRTAPSEPTTPIRPSEAIRLGTLLRPVQCSGHELHPDDPTKACAWGALRLGYGDDHALVNAAAAHRIGKCPGSDSCHFNRPDSVPLYTMWAVAHLNDGYCMNGVGWSRERIADWLEGLGL
jgi:hypothetical protein